MSNALTVYGENSIYSTLASRVRSELMVLHYLNYSPARSVLTARRSNVDDVKNDARRLFKIPSNYFIRLYLYPDLPGGRRIEIDPLIWHTIWNEINEVGVTGEYS
ncbi:hypothetical protein M408DRAFT_332436 [Serendipita vermifera MAFF 305830]|uniref:Uncharacterized protein n=1 Tax=Serendipita vermifera MAFF 305830 TaxID=933852 RepID=A0A0C2X158_SERVB|nr:hypothetical protein M408DRAFT_332436 [Serendipita vermifera MAFF 305830]